MTWHALTDIVERVRSVNPDVCTYSWRAAGLRPTADPGESCFMKWLIAILILSLGIVAPARSENYPVPNGRWRVLRSEINGVTTTFVADGTACSAGPHMEFEGDRRVWTGITSQGSHTLRSVRQRGDGVYSLDEDSKPFDVRVLEIVDVDRIKLTLGNGAVVWLAYCYRDR